MGTAVGNTQQILFRQRELEFFLEVSKYPHRKGAVVLFAMNTAREFILQYYDYDYIILNIMRQGVLKKHLQPSSSS